MMEKMLIRYSVYSSSLLSWPLMPQVSLDLETLLSVRELFGKFSLTLFVDIDLSSCTYAYNHTILGQIKSFLGLF